MNLEKNTNNNLLDLSIIIPAYNEERKIKKDILESFKFLAENSLSGEVVVSTDGVTDNTNRIVKEMQKNYPNLILIAKKKKIGKGAAIKKGVEAARGRIIMFADAGLCVPFKFGLTGIKKLNNDYDIAIGSRASKKSRVVIQQPLYRRLGSKIFSFIIRNILQIPKEIKDTQCGFKLYKRKVGKILFGELEEKGMMFDVEIILRAKKHGYRIKSFPVLWRNDPDTKFNPFFGSIINIKELVKIKLIHRL